MCKVTLKEWGVPERITRLRWSGGALTLGTPHSGGITQCKKCQKKTAFKFFPMVPTAYHRGKKKKNERWAFWKSQMLTWKSEVPVHSSSGSEHFALQR
jgi:hypothetical protein